MKLMLSREVLRLMFHVHRCTVCKRIRSLLL